MRIYYRRRTGPVWLLLLLVLAIGVVTIYAASRLVYTASLDSRALNVGLTAPVKNLEPALIASHEERLIASMLYEGLVRWDEAGNKIQPLLADEWKYEENGQKIVFRLKNVQFSNGKKVQASDIKTCWEKTLASSKEWSHMALFLPVAGGSDFIQGKSPEIAGVKAINEKTLEVTLTAPNAAFIHMLTNPVFWIYDSQDSARPPAGTGPFIVQQNDGQRLALLQNENYHQGMPPLKAIEVKVFNDPAQALAEFKAGQLDYLDKVNPQNLPELRNDPEYKRMLLEKPLYTLYGIGFNMNKKPFAGNYLLRRAMNYAVDRQAINKDVLGEAYIPLKGILPAELPGHNKDIPGYGYDPEKARQLLEQAGYPGGKGLSPLMLAYNQGEGHQRVAESIASQLSEVGIPIQLAPLTWEYYKKQLASYNLALFRLEWSADYPDSDSILYSLFHSSHIGNSNYFGYNNHQVDKLLDASRQAVDNENERVKLLQKAEQIIIDDAPCIWLFQTATAKLVQENVDNLRVNSLNLVDWSKVVLKKPVFSDTAKTPSEGNGKV
ncbi:MAG: ABC transporter substrate-binding protein [Syntrophomonadaceae bacterium]|jgi:oligopeptide transport system substrate-binding protein|nr:ABC transporter substrate-binding protein [Syntrophomonadaceae bacterium]